MSERALAGTGDREIQTVRETEKKREEEGERGTGGRHRVIFTLHPSLLSFLLSSCFSPLGSTKLSLIPSRMFFAHMTGTNTCFQDH